MSKKSMRILIVDDEKPMARAMQLKLEHEGFEVDTAYDGESVPTLVEKGDYALVLLDLVMPKYDGFSVLEEFKKRGISIPVIVLSNLSQQEDEKRVRALGAKDFYIKSNTPLANIVQKVTALLS